MKIVFLDRGTLSPETVLRPPGFVHSLEAFDRTTPDQIAERIADADIVITNKVKLSAAALQGADNIDLAACAARGITVSNIRNYASHTVPEHTFGLIFALRRSICAYHDSVRAGRWQQAGQFCYFDHPIRDLAGSTLGIVGDGALGNAVATMGRALGMRVLFAAFKGSTGMGSLYTPFDEMLERSDVITLHCPLTTATRDMIGAPEFVKMKRKPLLINTARGGLVDEAALAVALREGIIGGAGFDVVSEEPPTPGHPFMALGNLPNFILTPHVAWASQQAIQSLADQLIDNVEAFVHGTPCNVVAAAAA
jgi:glycerate dehydrogenase